MKIDVSKLIQGKPSIIEEDFLINEEEFKVLPPLLKVNSIKVKAKVSRYEDFVDVNLSINAKVVLQCSYTLKPFDSVMKGFDELHFAVEVEEGSDFVLYTGNVITLDPYIYNLISASVPTSPKSKGATLPNNGNGYRVLSEEDLKREKEDKGDSRFDALKDLEFD